VRAHYSEGEITSITLEAFASGAVEWCRQLGLFTLVCYTGFEDLLEELPDTLDVLFVGAFTEAAHTAYNIGLEVRRER